MKVQLATVLLLSAADAFTLTKPNGGAAIVLSDWRGSFSQRSSKLYIASIGRNKKEDRLEATKATALEREPSAFSSDQVAIEQLVSAGDVAAAEKALSDLSNATAELYNIVLAGYVKQGKVAAAERLVKQIPEPNVQSYHLLLDVLAVSPSVDAGDRAEQILRLLTSEQYNHQSTVAYNQVLKVWKNSGHPEAADRAEKLVQEMKSNKLADAISYTSLFGALAKVGTAKAARKAISIAEQAENPNVQMWNSVVFACIRANDLDRAEEILERMEDDYARKGNASLMAPNVVTYSTLMDGYAKQNAVPQTQAIFDRMVKLYQSGNQNAKPNAIAYTTLLHTYARRRSKDSAQKAQDLLFEMYERYRAGEVHLKPNTQLVSSVMDSWHHSGTFNAGEKAEALLDWMVETSDPDFEPNEYSFSSAIAAWAKSRRIGKSVQARRILDKMIELHETGKITAHPNTICYTAVINSCAYCENDEIDKKNALRIAVSTFRDLRDSTYAAPNHVTYSMFLTALRNLVQKGPKRSVAIQDVFKTAIQNGCVDEVVLKRLKSALTREELQSLLPAALVGTAEIRLEMLPNEWRRNVVLSS